MKDNFDLFLTQNYDASAISEAKNLYAYNSNGLLARVNEVTTAFTVNDGSKLYDVSIEHPLTKRQVATCQCTTFIEKGGCKHIVLTLMFIIDQDTKPIDDLIQEPAAKEVSKKLARLSTKDIISAVSHSDLIDFLVAYARNDAKMSTAIKVHFARQIEVGDDIDKYKSILNAIIKPITDTTSKVNITDLRSLCFVLEDFWGQMQDCLALGQYMEAYHIFVASFDKLNYVRHHSTTMQEKLSMLSQKYHSSITDMLKEKLAPELRTKFMNYLMEMMSRSYYHFFDPRQNIVYQIIVAGRKSDLSSLSTALENKVGSHLDEQGIIIALKILIHKKVEQSHIDEINTQKIPTVIVMSHLEIMESPQLALALGKTYAKKNKDIDKTLALKMAHIYVNLNNSEELHSHMVDILTKTMDVKLFDGIKHHIDKPLAFSILYQVAQNVPKNEKTLAFKILIYKEMDDVPNVIDCVQSNIANLGLIKSVEAFLYTQDHHSLLQLYVIHLSHYLDNHIGDNTHDYLKALRIHMTHSKMDKLIIPMVKMLTEKYGHRPSLAKAFALMM